MDGKRKTSTSTPLYPNHTIPTTPPLEPQASGCCNEIESAIGPWSQQLGTSESPYDIDSSSSNSATGLFNASSNIDVHGGHFNQTMGHNTSVIINDENSISHITSGRTRAAVLLPTPNHVSSTITPQSIIDTATRTTVSVSERPPERISRMLISVGNGNEIYEQHLQTKRRGFPLWIPEPNQRLSVSYRRKGVSIGDVGIITPSGGFSFLFNVCLPGDHPINPRILPKGFSPIYPALDEDDILQFSEFKPGSYLASSSVEELQNDPNTKGMTFQTSASEAAILTMPDGAITQDLENMTRLRAYAAANIENWYRYANGVKGREAKNGDIRLVIGWNKAPSWGMAALTNFTQERVCYLKFKPVEDLSSHPSVPPYTWEYSGMADVRVGPNSEDIEELRRHDADPGAKYTNQCLFIRTLNPTLNDDIWNSLNQELALNLIQEFPGYRHPGLGKASNNGNQSSNSQLFSATSGFQKSSSIGNQIISQSAIIDETLPSSVTVSIDPDVRRSHPSDELNKILQELTPTARVIITRDQDWFPYVNEYSLTPNVAQLRERIKTDYSIICDQGVTYLEPKTSDKSPNSDHVNILVPEEPTRGPHGPLDTLQKLVPSAPSTQLSMNILKRDPEPLMPPKAIPLFPGPSPTASSRIPKAWHQQPESSNHDWARRPRQENIYEELDTFFPNHDLDSIVIEATSGDARLANNGLTKSLPFSDQVDKDAGKWIRTKTSVRMIAHEYIKTMQKSEDADVVPQDDSMKRLQNTKLWGSKLEEITSTLRGRNINSMIPPSELPSGESITNTKPTVLWIRGELIGKGTYGRVYLALNVTTGEFLAVKKVEFPQATSDGNQPWQKMDLRALRMRSEAMRDLSHPHIVQYLGFEETHLNANIFLEYVAGGSIRSYIHQHGKLSNDITRSFIAQILNGLGYLHSKGVVHLGLRAESILLDLSGVCKIADLGLRGLSEQDLPALTDLPDSVFLMPPEGITANTTGNKFKFDIWAVGCIALEMWTGTSPLTTQKMVPDTFQVNKSKAAPPVPEDVVLSEEADDFRCKCFVPDPEERPSAAELQKHPYLILPPD